MRQLGPAQLKAVDDEVRRREALNARTATLARGGAELEVDLHRLLTPEESRSFLLPYGLTRGQTASLMRTAKTPAQLDAGAATVSLEGIFEPTVELFKKQWPKDLPMVPVSLNPNFCGGA